MKNGICPRCGSNELLSNLRVRGGEGHPPFVDIHEPEKRPFVWIPKSGQSQFRAYVCGACGYTEFYAENYLALNEGRKKGFIHSWTHYPARGIVLFNRHLAYVDENDY